jgi:negative regulator of sigma-B (phosphoserine phosphatase)
MSVSRPPVEWGVAARPFPGEEVSGDLHVARPFPGGILVAVVDGLGHGRGANAAARAAGAVLESHAREPVERIFERCHQELRRTRGVAMSAASLTSRGMLSWMGVGNVEGLLLRADANGRAARESVVLRGGVVGYRLPTLRASTATLEPGDTLILATDGLRQSFADGLEARGAPQRIADRLLAGYARGNDDALVLVARYLGGAP